VRYSVALIVTLIILAKMAGMSSLAGIADWVRLRGDWLSQVLPTSRKSFPCAATYSNVLRAVDAEQVRQILNDLLTRLGATQRCEEEASRLPHDQPPPEEHVHVALDGKTLRGTLGHSAPDQQKMQQLALYETDTGVLLKEQGTGEKQNEVSIVSQFLIPALVKGRIISADALHTQHLFCFSVTRWDGDYVLIAKGNQAGLHEDLQLFFSEPPPACRDWRTARTIDKGHGRLEIGELIATTELNEFLAPEWAGVSQVLQLKRTVYEDDQVRTEIVYGITSLSPKQASAARLLQLVRHHWAMEIVQSHLTKTHLFTPGGGGDHIADLHLIFCHDDTIHQQLNQLSFLLKGRIRHPLRNALAERFARLNHGRQLVMPLHIYLQMAHLLRNRLQSLLQFLPSSLVLFELEYLSQIGIG
jgi:hypothetical protein